MTEHEFFDTLEVIGWIDAVPKPECTRLSTAVADAFTRDPKYAFYSLAVTSFDPECIEGSGPDDDCSYYSVVTQLAKASYGKFTPTDLRDELDETANLARVSFTHGGKVFKCEVRWEDDWFQEPVLDLVNTAIMASNAKEQFIPLPPAIRRSLSC